ncbi:hypothetical protein DFH27DRAFT_567094 [Peziza echinospora]|nr:hypothetical protein DFH27DRAFT_567094 [Peziza echinospora]
MCSAPTVTVTAISHSPRNIHLHLLLLLLLRGLESHTTPTQRSLDLIHHLHNLTYSTDMHMPPPLTKYLSISLSSRSAEHARVLRRDKLPRFSRGLSVRRSDIGREQARGVGDVGVELVGETVERVERERGEGRGGRSGL